MTQPFTCWTTEVGAADAARVGGKAAALGELARAGLPVPRGFVITTAAFLLHMDGMDPDGAARGALGALAADDLAGIARAAAGLRGRVVAQALPPEVAAEIAPACAALGDGPVAVRSSATLEDSAEASFAGLQDTYLAVRGAGAVLDRVRACWTSLYNDELIAYRRRQGTGEDGLAMGVVVQRMLNPRSAGVMFTRSPVTGDRSVVAIEGTWGLGSALVGGEVTPDSFTVSKVTGEITGRRVAVKLRLHSFTPNGQGVSATPMAVPLRRTPCLTDDEVRALARLGRQVEDHYGAPQDIEWALLGDSPGRFVLLQSRPETVWTARDRGPIASPQAKASDHVLARFSRGCRWDVNPLTNDDVADILALLDSLPYDELDLETPRFRLTLRRTAAGWTQSTQVLSAPDPLATPASAPPANAPAPSTAPEVKGPLPPSIGGKGPFTPVDGDGNGGGEADEAEGELVVVRAPLPGTFYRAPRPGAAPFVEVGSQVGADTVIGIVRR